MEQPEQEELVSELETRVDRLRSLYEQYFMGIEKLEPGVPRKDVDRRIQILRKEQIRNTGLRFRFQMILQRYNTYQTYWQRICREIENGTFKRHMMKAQQRFAAEAKTGTRRKSIVPEAPDTDQSLAFDTIPPPAPGDAAILEDEDFAAFAELEDFGRVAKQKMADLDFGALEDPLARAPSSMSMPAVRPAAPPPAARSPAPVGTAAPPALPPSTPKMQPAAASAAPPGGRVWRKAAPAEPRQNAPSPPAATAPRPGPPPVPTARPPLSSQAPIARPPSANATARPPIPNATARPASAPMAAAAPTAPAAPKAPAAPTAPRPPPATAAPKPAPRPAAPADLPDERVRQLYAQYVETKRKQNESTAGVTYDNLAKSLRESSARLREKHGKTVDFEVAVKDGKTILKPVVK